MRYAVLSPAFAAACSVALATIAIQPASAELKQIGNYSPAALQRACSGAGGTYHTGGGGEHYCTKGANIVDCNGRNNCIGGTPRGSATSGTGGATTKPSAYLGTATRAAGQGARPVADLAQRTGRHHR